ncbi:MAG: Gfo/Idh/MocA family oxidoreductase [Planctomycetaceae bacterium]|jgi:predicted dehydrogenase|nr:Gfo/Idh/MocA family oxidoreductase [Planctomycetaceae bacterium]
MKRTEKLTSNSRRQFLKTAAVVGVGSVFAPAVLADKSPNSKLNIGVIGVGGDRAPSDISEMVQDTKGSEKLLAFCDVNKTTLDKQSDKYNVEHRYQDYRVMFDEKAKELDAVIVVSMDHTHGLIASTAMNLGLHCYCEKPLANSVWEIRLMSEIAKKKKLCTQTGTQVRSWKGAHYYRSFELIRAGAIGDVKEVFIWCEGSFAPTKEDEKNPVGETPVPSDFNYDVWLGPVPFRPFNKAWLSWPGRFAYWHSSNGYVAGMGPHTIDMVWTALNLTPPETIEVDGLDQPNPLYNSDKQHITWTHKKADGNPLKVHWFDSKRRPEGLPENLIDPKQNNAIVFLGTEGSLQVHYGYHTLFPKEKYADFKAPAPTYAPSIGHQRQWVEAIKANKPELCECNIPYASHYTEAVVLAVNAYRAGVKKIKWNSEKMETDSKEVNAFIKPKFREGWDFPTL